MKNSISLLFIVAITGVIAFFWASPHSPVAFVRPEIAQATSKAVPQKVLAFSQTMSPLEDLSKQYLKGTTTKTTPTSSSQDKKSFHTLGNDLATIKWERSAIKRLPVVRAKYGALIKKTAEKKGVDVDPNLVIKIILIESEGYPNRVSPTGAGGLMQLTSIAQDDVNMHGDVFNPTYNIKAGTIYLGKLQHHYGYKTPSAIGVAYNIGPIAARSMSESQIVQQRYAQKMAFLDQYVN
jgi:soluble lytic murein transglycosylase-like protein